MGGWEDPDTTPERKAPHPACAEEMEAVSSVAGLVVPIISIFLALFSVKVHVVQYWEQGSHDVLTEGMKSIHRDVIIGILST